MYGLPMLWWARIGKYLQFLGGTVVVLDLIGPDRLTAFGDRMPRMEQLSKSAMRIDGVKWLGFKMMASARFLQRIRTLEFRDAEIAKSHQRKMLWIKVADFAVVIFAAIVAAVGASLLFPSFGGSAVSLAIEVFGAAILFVFCSTGLFLVSQVSLFLFFFEC